jgi:hypothetical protein
MPVKSRSQPGTTPFANSGPSLTPDHMSRPECLTTGLLDAAVISSTTSSSLDGSLSRSAYSCEDA